MRSIYDQPREWLIKNFSQGADEYPVNVARLMRNIIWQTRERIVAGQKPPLKELIRTFRRERESGRGREMKGEPSRMKMSKKIFSLIFCPFFLFVFSSFCKADFKIGFDFGSSYPGYYFSPEIEYNSIFNPGEKAKFRALEIFLYPGIQPKIYFEYVTEKKAGFGFALGYSKVKGETSEDADTLQQEDSVFTSMKVDTNMWPIFFRGRIPISRKVYFLVGSGLVYCQGEYKTNITEIDYESGVEVGRVEIEELPLKKNGFIRD